MKLRLSILNVYAMLFLAICIGYTIINYKALSEGEGWGVVFMIGLCGIGIVLLVLDIVIQIIFKDRRTINIIGTILALAASVLILSTDF